MLFQFETLLWCCGMVKWPHTWLSWGANLPQSSVNKDWWAWRQQCWQECWWASLAVCSSFPLEKGTRLWGRAGSEASQRALYRIIYLVSLVYHCKQVLFSVNILISPLFLNNYVTYTHSSQYFVLSFLCNSMHRSLFFNWHYLLH